MDQIRKSPALEVRDGTRNQTSKPKDSEGASRGSAAREISYCVAYTCWGYRDEVTEAAIRRRSSPKREGKIGVLRKVTLDERAKEGDLSALRGARRRNSRGREEEVVGRIKTIRDTKSKG